MTNIELQQLALKACFELNGQLLEDEGAQGYEGTKECFDRLFAEVYVIARDEVPNASDITMIVHTFWDYFEEIEAGAREVDWYC